MGDAVLCPAQLGCIAGDVLEALNLAANINPFGSVQNADARDAARTAIAKAGGYSHRRIAWELERTALNDGFWGNALRVAKDIPGITEDDRSLLGRYATGRKGGTDHVKLQALALRVYNLPNPGRAADPGQQTVAPNKDDTTVVDEGYHWRPIDEHTPRGRKLQLINEQAGVAVYGVLAAGEHHFTHWAPLPTFRKA